MMKEFFLLYPEECAKLSNLKVAGSSYAILFAM